MATDAAPNSISALLTPVVIGRSRTVNRIVMAPMTNKQSHEDGRPSIAEIDWLVRRAEGGFGPKRQAFRT